MNLHLHFGKTWGKLRAARSDYELPTRASPVSRSPDWTGFDDEAPSVGGGLQGQTPPPPTAPAERLEGGIALTEEVVGRRLEWLEIAAQAIARKLESFTSALGRVEGFVVALCRATGVDTNTTLPRSGAPSSIEGFLEGLLNKVQKLKT